MPTEKDCCNAVCNGNTSLGESKTITSQLNKVLRTSERMNINLSDIVARLSNKLNFSKNAEIASGLCWQPIADEYPLQPVVWAITEMGEINERMFYELASLVDKL